MTACPLGNTFVCNQHAVLACFKAGQDHRKVNATCVELTPFFRALLLGAQWRCYLGRKTASRNITPGVVLFVGFLHFISRINIVLYICIISCDTGMKGWRKEGEGQEWRKGEGREQRKGILPLDKDTLRKDILSPFLLCCFKFGVKICNSYTKLLSFCRLRFLSIQLSYVIHYITWKR